MQEAIYNDDANDKERKRRGHRDLARHRECIRDESDKVAKQHEQEKRENEGKKRMPSWPPAMCTVGCDELVGHLGQRLQPAGESARDCVQGA